MIFLNYKPIISQPTGIGVYANAVLPAFDQLEHILIRGGGPGGAKERLKRLVWSQVQLPRLAKKRKADLIFTPAPEGYLGEQSVPQVIMVHDLRPLSHPELSMQSLYFRKWVPALLKECKHILANSLFTATEIIRLTGVSDHKISVTPLGYDDRHFYPGESSSRLHSRPYLLNIGQPYPHKNLQCLIRAFNSVASRFPDVDLILLGKPHLHETPKLRRLAVELGLSHRVFFKNYVSYNELPNWYRGAIALVYPSLWEGFGLPILEAMACATPVITSYGSGTEEIAGTGAFQLVDPRSQSSVEDSLLNILGMSPSNRFYAGMNGVEVAQSFSWDQTRMLTKHAIEIALSA